MNHKVSQLLLCLLLIIGFGCKKNNDDAILSNQTSLKVNAAITGLIVNDRGIGIAGCEVKAGTATTTTDANGAFKFADVEVIRQAAFVEASKAGYFTGSRTFIARQNQSYYVEIELLTKGSNGKLNSATGGTITIPNGSSVQLPGASVVTESTGAAYNGMVDVSIAWIDPTSKELNREMPGDLRGINNSNNEVGLQTFGMLSIALTGAAGEKLQIATAKKASLVFPLPTTISVSAPATIDLWSFNDTTGLWKQEGTARRSGNNYIADVSHFSWWNCDYAFPIIKLTVSIRDQSDKPLPYTLVKITNISTGSVGTCWTDAEGIASGKVPANTALRLEVVSRCGNILATKNIGPFNQDTDLGTVTGPITSNQNVQPATVSGTVQKCNGANVLKGHVTISVADGTVYESVYKIPIVNGSFTGLIQLCSEAGSAAKVVAADYDDMKKSTLINTTVNVGTNVVPTITTCTTIDYYIKATIDSSLYIYLQPIYSLSGGENLSSPYADVQAYINNGNYFRPQFYYTQGSYFIDWLYSNENNYRVTYFPSSSIPTNISFPPIGNVIYNQYNEILRDGANVAHRIQYESRVIRTY